MRLLFLLFTNLLAFLVVRRVRRAIAPTLIGAVAFTMFAPPARAQIGIDPVIAAATAVVKLQLVNQARALVSSMISQYRGLLMALLQVNVSSAQLANPVALESVIRDRNPGNFGQLTSAYGKRTARFPQRLMRTRWSATWPISTMPWPWRT